MNRLVIWGLLTLFLIGTLTVAFDVRPGWAIAETVHIMSDGSIVPFSAPISSTDNVTYSLNGDITYPAYLGIVVEKNNVVIDGTGHTVRGDSMYDNSYGLGLTSQSNVTVENANVNTFHWGIQLVGCSNCTVSGNNVTENLVGIEIGFSSDNTISGNNAISNGFVGIEVGDYSNNNIIVGNNAVENGIYLSVNPVEGGIFVDVYADGNTVKENNMTTNRNGMYLGGASNTKIYHNNFENNIAQVYEDMNGVGSTSTWNDAYPSGGNYWSDYNGSDFFRGPYQNETGSDGMGDTPYSIDVNNTDQYPLMKPYTGLESIVDWWPMFHHDLIHTGYSISAAPQTNRTFWCYTTDGMVISSPSVVNGTVYIGSNDGNLYALNASTGAYIWTYPTGLHVQSSPAIADGMVYIGSSYNETCALNASTGTLAWSFNTGGFVFSSPAVADGTAYVGSDDGNVYALDARDGTLVWTYTTQASVESSPAVVDGSVYVGSDDGTVYAFGQLPISTSVSISPRAVAMDLGQSQVFTSTVSGNAGSYAYRWYLNDTPVPTATSESWIFMPNAPGFYIVYLNVTDSFGNMFVSNPSSVTVSLTSTTVHDVAVTNVTVPVNMAYQGRIINVSVTVANFGDATENFITTLDYDANTIGSQLIMNLAPNETQSLLFSWNTTDVPYSYAHNYTIAAVAGPVSGEANLTNNQLTGGQVQIRVVGDVNGDGVVDMRDVAVAVSAFNTWPGKSRWNPNCDLDLNGIVNTKDIVIILMNFKHA